MKTQILIFVFLILGLNHVHSQNMVANPGFETVYSGYPAGTTSEGIFWTPAGCRDHWHGTSYWAELVDYWGEIPNWTHPDRRASIKLVGTADVPTKNEFYKVNSSFTMEDITQIPWKTFDHNNPNTNDYKKILYSRAGDKWLITFQHEYAAGDLSIPMLKDKWYLVEYYVATQTQAFFAGVQFRQDQAQQRCQDPLDNAPNVAHVPIGVLATVNDKGYKKVMRYFKSDDDYNKMMVGSWNHSPPSMDNSAIYWDEFRVTNICEEHRLLNYEDYNHIDGHHMLTAGKTITCDGTVNVHTGVSFQAGESITIKKKFHAKKGSIFWAKIQPCDDLGPPANTRMANPNIQIDDEKSVESLTLTEGNQILVFPNPSIGEFTIQGLPENSEFIVYNLQGEIVIDSKKMNTGASSIKIDLLNQPKGMYVIKVQMSDGNVHLERIILK